MRRSTSVWSAAERLASTGRGAAVLFAVAVGFYAVESVALPLIPGRDFGTYLRFYDQMWEWHSVLPMSMLYRTPVTPLVAGGSLDLLGGFGAQVLMGALYAGSVVAWSAVGRAFGRRVALVTAVALVVFPGYAILFHELASDAIFAAGFAGWALLVSRAYVRQSLGRWLSVGLGVAVLALIRPGNQVLIVAAALPLVLALPWRRRVALSAAAAGAAVAVLGLWAVNNGVRYGDYAVARGGAAYTPFFRAFIADRIVSPDNGPASKELAAAVARDLLPQEPYRSYGIDLKTFFSQGNDREFEDLLGLSDRVWGWDTDYSKLREVGVEAVRAHPSAYARGVANTIWDQLWHPLYVALPASRGSGSSTSSGGGPTIVVHGRTLPEPSENMTIPAAHQGFYSTTPDHRIREVWTSPTAHQVVFDTPAAGRRFARMNTDIGRLWDKVPPYRGSAWLTLQFSRSSRLYPRPALFLVVGLVALLWRRPRHAVLALALGAAAILVVLFNAVTIYPIIEFAVPVVPALVLLSAAGLVGERVGGRPSRLES